MLLFFATLWSLVWVIFVIRSHQFQRVRMDRVSYELFLLMLHGRFVQASFGTKKIYKRISLTWDWKLYNLFDHTEVTWIVLMYGKKTPIFRFDKSCWAIRTNDVANFQAPVFNVQKSKVAFPIGKIDLFLLNSKRLRCFLRSIDSLTHLIMLWVDPNCWLNNYI